MAEILGPIMIGIVYEYYGPKSIMSIMHCTLSITLLIYLVMLRYAAKHCKGIKVLLALSPNIYSNRPQRNINLQISDASVIIDNNPIS